MSNGRTMATPTKHGGDFGVRRLNALKKRCDGRRREGERREGGREGGRAKGVWHYLQQEPALPSAHATDAQGLM